MIRKQSAEEQIATMQRLIKFGVNESTAAKSKPIVEFKRKAANGKTYGIVCDATKYYIMEAPQKDTEILAEDFQYIGGYNNRKENEYSSYAKASNALDLKIMSINETVDKANRVILETPSVKSEWEDSITESMRKEINRFKTITSNVAEILREDKGHGQIPSEHKLPGAPAKNPSDKKVNSPYTESGVANGEKDFSKEEHNHETAGTPFNKNAKSSVEKNMQSDKKPVVKTDAEYLTKEETYEPENNISSKHPSGGKVVKVNENKNNKIRLRLTEEQVLAWNDNKNYMDTSHGTKIGSSEPYDDELGKESNQTEAPTEPIHESEGSVVHNNPNQNVPSPGTNEVGDTDPYEELNEEIVDAVDAAGSQEEDDDYPFPEVMDDDEEEDVEVNDDDWYNPEDEDEYEIEVNPEDIYKKLGKDGYKDDFDPDWDKNWNVFDDDDDLYEKRNRSRRRLSEEKLNVFGKHPAYRKRPMTTPPNREVAINGAREWDDESAQGEEPFGKQIGDSAPYEKIVDGIAESIMKYMYSDKKKD